MKRNILLILLIVCLITIVLQSCENDNNNDKETNERIPPGPPLHFIPMSTVVNSQFLLSPLIPTREIALPLATLQDEDYGEYDCILRNVNTTTNRLSFNVKYYRCSPAYIKELDIYDQDLDYDYDIYTVLFSVTLIGDAPFESFEITEVTLEFNYQEVKVPVSIKIYDRRNFGEYKDDWLLPVKTARWYHGERIFASMELYGYDTLISAMNTDGSELKNATIFCERNTVFPHESFSFDTKSSLEINLENNKIYMLYVGIEWDIDLSAPGYYSREIIFKYISDGIEYIRTRFFDFCSENLLENALIINEEILDTQQQIYDKHNVQKE